MTSRALFGEAPVWTGLARVRRSAWSRLNSLPIMRRAAIRAARADRVGGYPLADPRLHLDAAVEWLTRAQDATPDYGVSRGYSLCWNPNFERRGWQPSYPETTGYIIPTFFDLAESFAREDLRARAMRMADWECEVQLPSGAVQGGVVGEQQAPTPAVFNTGQVIFGWIRAHREGGSDQHIEAALRAGEFLLDCQDPDGAFRRASSQFARADSTVYNTRVAWALCALGSYVGDRRFLEAGERNVAFALTRQLENGWFESNCLSDPEIPLLHTIAYAARGILEVGLLLQSEDFIDAAERAALGLASRQREDGGLSGRFDRNWSARTLWDCLTGDAQTAIIWWKLGGHRRSSELERRARELCRFVMRSQDRSNPDPGIRGGIKGSFPSDGGYGTDEVLNWPTKFFVDALLLTHGTELAGL